MPTCPSCATAVEAGARFCSQCGAAIAEPDGAAPADAPSDAQAEPTTTTPGPAGAPATHGLSDRNWAVFAHLSALIPLVVGVPLTFLGPLVLWLIVRERGAFAADQAVEALNFNISWLLWTLAVVVAGVAVAVPTVGLALIPVALVVAGMALAWLILVIVAAVQASSGQRYRYPLTLRFISP